MYTIVKRAARLLVYLTLGLIACAFFKTGRW
jgi:hypothetical protein